MRLLIHLTSKNNYSDVLVYIFSFIPSHELKIYKYNKLTNVQDTSIIKQIVCPLQKPTNK